MFINSLQLLFPYKENNNQKDIQCDFTFNVADKAFTIKRILGNLIKGTSMSTIACLCFKYSKQC